MRYKEDWLKILNYIDVNGKEIGTFTIVNRVKSYFTVKVDSEKLVVSNANTLKPSCKINMNRSITYKQFEDSYYLYDRYINKEEGIREKMRYLSNNSSYIISIIHQIL